MRGGVRRQTVPGFEAPKQEQRPQSSKNRVGPSRFATNAYGFMPPTSKPASVTNPFENPKDFPNEDEETIGIREDTDLTAGISRPPDHTWYSVPQDGSPLTIPTISTNEQTSLMVEYFKEGEGPNINSSKPGVWVRLAP